MVSLNRYLAISGIFTELTSECISIHVSTVAIKKKEKSKYKQVDNK